MNSNGRTLPLDQIAEFEGGSQPPKSEFIYEPRQGYVRFLQIRDFKSDKNETYIKVSNKNRTCCDDDILIGRYGASVGQILTGKAGAYNVALMKAMPDTSIIARRYFYHYLNSVDFQIRLMGVADRSAQNGFSKEDIANFPVLVPPIPEQKRIVAILDEAFAGIAAATANAEKNLTNARELFDGCLDEAFSETKTGRKLATLTELTTDITDGDHMPPPKSLTGVPFITISNIHKGTNAIDFSDTFKVPRAYFDNLKPNKRPQLGDVLYTVTGSFGIPVIVQDSTEFCFQRHIGLVRPKKGVNSKWLYYALLSPPAFKQAADGATGTAQKTVSLKVLRSLQLPDIPLVEQVAMASRLDALYARTKSLESVYTEKLASILELKRALLQKAFSGELAALPGAEMQEAAA
ncbi:MAG: restriction endonuclease subunit S [Acidocella sp.]|nr:restriction endonuclease subunit S [Acidocella sp.]